VGFRIIGGDGIGDGFSTYYLSIHCQSDFIYKPVHSPYAD